ncbi:MAG: hypothetical protein AB7T74_07070 [Clostridia bacterium]|jgi:hypothetical protein|nr:hypothetical protein [Spirochaetia bacterium]
MNRMIMMLLFLTAGLAAVGSQERDPAELAFEQAIHQIINVYLQAEIENFNIIITVREDHPSRWRARIEVYKYQSFEIVIDAMNKTIQIIDNTKTIDFYQSRNGPEHHSGKYWIIEHFQKGH